MGVGLRERKYVLELEGMRVGLGPLVSYVHGEECCCCVHSFWSSVGSRGGQDSCNSVPAGDA